jgi:hypothetical protein
MGNESFPRSVATKPLKPMAESHEFCDLGTYLCLLGFRNLGDDTCRLEGASSTITPDWPLSFQL